MDWHLMLRAALLVAGALVASGCAGPDGTGSTAFLASDSSGVRIAVNRGVEMDTVVVDDAVLTIGRDGDARYEFFRIDRVLGLSDGRVVVADRGSQELRYYSADGEFQIAMGGPGEGPGEFVSLWHAQRLPGDTVAVGDQRTRRVQYFSPTPSMARSMRYSEHLSPMPAGITLCAAPLYLGVLRGFVLNRGWSCLRETGTEGWVSYMSSIEAWRPLDDSVSMYGLSPSFTTWERPGEEIRNRFVRGHFPVGTAVDVGEEHVVLASTDEYRLDVFSPDGTLLLSVRDSVPLRSVDAELRDRFWESVPQEDRIEYEGIPFVDSLPAFDRVRVADNGYWARYYPLPGATAEHWAVFGADGRKLATIGFPAGFSLSSVYRERAYGVSTDTLGVETVVVHALPPLR